MARGLLTREHCLSLYHGLAHPARALAGASCSGAAAACLHTSSSAGQATAAQSAKQQAGAASQQGAAARVGGAASKQKQQRRKRYAPEVLAYFAEVKAWNRKMSELKQQWRADLLQRHWATQAQRRAAELTALKTDVQGGTAAKQAQTVLEDELKKAETELELAEIKLQRAKKFESARQRLEEQRAARYNALLEASRTWISRAELQGRINAALDNPQPFGFVNTLPDAKRAL